MKNFKDVFTQKLTGVIKEASDQFAQVSSLDGVPGSAVQDPGAIGMGAVTKQASDSGTSTDAGEILDNGGNTDSPAVSKAKECAREIQSFVTRIMEMISELDGTEFDGLLDIKFSPAMSGLQEMVTALTAKIRENSDAKKAEAAKAAQQSAEAAANPGM
jgi:hypothetical protein